MAREELMCSYSNISGYGYSGHDALVLWVDQIKQAEIFKKPNKRVKCPVCGRKMWAARRTCHDGCCEMYCVPPHKVKGWWKKGRKKKTSRDGTGRGLR